MEVTKESAYGNGFKFPKIILKRKKFEKSTGLIRMVSANLSI